MMLEREFRSDLFAAESWLNIKELSSDNLVEVPITFDDIEKSNKSIMDAIITHGKTVSVFLMSAVHYLSSQFFDVPAI